MKQNSIEEMILDKTKNENILADVKEKFKQLEDMNSDYKN